MQTDILSATLPDKGFDPYVVLDRNGNPITRCRIKSIYSPVGTGFNGDSLWLGKLITPAQVSTNLYGNIVLSGLGAKLTGAMTATSTSVSVNYSGYLYYNDYASIGSEILFLGTLTYSPNVYTGTSTVSLTSTTDLPAITGDFTTNPWPSTGTIVCYETGELINYTLTNATTMQLTQRGVNGTTATAQPATWTYIYSGADTFTNCYRGIYGTVATPHPVNAPVYYSFTGTPVYQKLVYAGFDNQNYFTLPGEGVLCDGPLYVSDYDFSFGPATVYYG